MQGKIATETRNARLYRISMSNKKAALRFFFSSDETWLPFS